MNSVDFCVSLVIFFPYGVKQKTLKAQIPCKPLREKHCPEKVEILFPGVIGQEATCEIHTTLGVKQSI